MSFGLLVLLFLKIDQWRLKVSSICVYFLSLPYTSYMISLCFRVLPSFPLGNKLMIFFKTKYFCHFRIIYHDFVVDQMEQMCFGHSSPKVRRDTAYISFLALFIVKEYSSIVFMSSTSNPFLSVF